MLEEHDSHMEHLHEEVQHQTHNRQEQSHWVTWAAMTAAIFAVLAAISSLISSEMADNAIADLIKSTDQWAYYQAKGVKAGIAESQYNILKQNNAPTDTISHLLEKKKRYSKEQETIKEEALKLEENSKRLHELHETFSHAVTFFQIAIAMIAIAVVSKLRLFLLVAAFIGCVGLFYFASGLLMQNQDQWFALLFSKKS